MEKWTPENPEEEPFAKLNLPNGQEFLATRLNTKLQMHLGRLAIYDNIFCDDSRIRFRIFNFVGGYEELQDYAMNNGFPMDINRTTVSKSTFAAYEKAIANSVTDIDTIPDDWL